MAALTWRNVDAPSFASANDMYRIAAGLMNSGFDAANAGIDRFRDTTTDEQSAALMQQVAAAGNDPAKVQAAIAAGNPAFLSADAIRFGNAQPGVLLERQGQAISNAQGGQAMRANDYNFDRTQATDARADEQRNLRLAADPLVAKAYAAAEAGDWNTANSIFTENADMFTKAGIDPLSTFQTLRSGQTSGITRVQQEDEFKNWQENVVNVDNAEALVSTAVQNFGKYGKDRVLKEIRSLAGTDPKFTEAMLQAAVTQADGLAIFNSAKTSPLGGIAGSLGMTTTVPANSTDTSWANGETSFAPPIAQTDNPVFNGFMGTVSTKVNNPYALAAIHATGQHESGFDASKAVGSWSDPSESGQQGTSGGVMSWRADRFAAMQANGLSPEQQAEYFLNEDPALIERLNNAGSVEEAQQLMNNAWRFAGFDRPGGEAAARLETAKSLLPSYLNGQTPSVQGSGPTRTNAAFMDRTGVNPLTTAAPDLSGIDAILGANGAAGPRATVQTTSVARAGGADDLSTPFADVAGDTPKAATNVEESNPTDAEAALTAAARSDATAVVGDDIVANANVPPPSTENAEFSGSVADYAPKTAEPVAEDTFPKVDTTQSQYVQDRQKADREQAINASIVGLIQRTADVSGNFASNAISDGWNYFAGTPEQGAENVATRDAAYAAADFYRENAEYFRQNPAEITAAQEDPVAYAQNFGSLPSQKAFAETQASIPSPAAQAAQGEAPASNNPPATPLAAAQAARAASVGELVEPSVLASTNTAVPLQQVFDTLIGQGKADQAANIYGTLDAMITNGTGKEQTPEDVRKDLMDNYFTEDDIDARQVTGALNELITEGVTPAMAGAILKHSVSATGGWFPWENQREVNMESAKATRDAFLGVQEDGSINTGPATRGQARQAEVQRAVAKLETLQSTYQQMVDAVTAAAADVTYTAEDRAAMAADIQAIEAKIREELAKIESTGILSAYSVRPANQ